MWRDAWENSDEGVQKVIKMRLICSDYEQCLSNMDTKSISTRSIRSDLHKLYTYSIQKFGLSAFDDKRFILGDGIHTLAHGHYEAV